MCFPPPSSLANRDEEDVALVGDIQARHALTLAHQGVCSACSGLMSAALVVGSENYFGHPLHALYECAQCEFHLHATLGEVVLDHPAVVSLFYDHGIDLRSMPRWELDFCFDEQYVERISEEPLRGRISIPCKGEMLELTLGETGGVIDTYYQ